MAIYYALSINKFNSVIIKKLFSRCYNQHTKMKNYPFVYMFKNFLLG